MIIRIWWFLLMVLPFANGLNISDCKEPKENKFCLGILEDGDKVCQKSLAGDGCFAKNNCQTIVVVEANRSLSLVKWKLYSKLIDDEQNTTWTEAGFFLNSSSIDFDGTSLPVQIHVPKLTATEACSVFVYANGTQRCTTEDHSDEDDIITPYIYQDHTKENNFTVAIFQSEAQLAQYPTSGEQLHLDLLSQEVYFYLYAKRIGSNDNGTVSTCFENVGPLLLFSKRSLSTTELPDSTTTTNTTTPDPDPRPPGQPARPPGRPETRPEVTGAPPPSRPSKGTGLGTGGIILIVLGVLIVIGIVATIVLFNVANKRGRKSHSSSGI